MKDKEYGALFGWLAIVSFVAAYDYVAINSGKETLSRSCWRAAESKLGRFPVALALGFTYKHLAFPNLLPKVDPFYWIAERWHKE